MNYFICHEWDNTKRNHAGMVHLCKEIQRIDKENVRVFVITDYFLMGKRIPFLTNFLYGVVALYLLIIVKVGDQLYLMEFLFPSRNQGIISKWIRRFRPGVRILAVPHLVPDTLEELFPQRGVIIDWIKNVDKVVTLGSSLTNYLVSIGVPEGKVLTSFHYVDDKFYYGRGQQLIVNTPIEIMIMGNMKRNTKLIGEIVSETPEVIYHYCKGMTKERFPFEELKNVRVYGFLKEEELRDLMERADVSLNVMEDTIGSNVITSSMAMGMAIIASDVGSIRDYCSEQNALFCLSRQDFISAINTLSSPRVLEMKTSSAKMAKRFCVDNFYLDIKNAVAS